MVIVFNLKTNQKYIDFHSHLLPNCDDGSFSIEETISIITILIDNGFIGTICTPHIWPKWLTQNNKKNVLMNIKFVNQQLKSKAINYKIWPGFELRVDSATLNWISDNGVPTLPDQKSVLLESASKRWTEEFEEMLNYLVMSNYRPIIAHPERSFSESSNHEYIYKIMSQDSISLQCNLSSFIGHYGHQVQRFAYQLLKYDLISYVGTDIHRLAQLPNSVLGIKKLKTQIGRKKLNKLLFHNPLSLTTPQDKL
jgi:tyrosine-protein phosphatase YwqE